MLYLILNINNSRWLEADTLDGRATGHEGTLTLLFPRVTRSGKCSGKLNVHMFPGRFTRHLNIVSINAFEDEILTKIFGSIADWHFSKGFDVIFLR